MPCVFYYLFCSGLHAEYGESINRTYLRGNTLRTCFVLCERSLINSNRNLTIEKI